MFWIIFRFRDSILYFCNGQEHIASSSPWVTFWTQCWSEIKRDKFYIVAIPGLGVIPCGNASGGREIQQFLFYLCTGNGGACAKATDLGHIIERWTYPLLAFQVRSWETTCLQLIASKILWTYFFLIVVFPCMLIITQLLFQQNA
jgi:hypothetical protein